MNQKSGNIPSASRNPAYNAAALEKIKNDLKSFETVHGIPQVSVVCFVGWHWFLVKDFPVPVLIPYVSLFSLHFRVPLHRS